MAVEAELHRRKSDGTLAPWLLVPDPDRGANLLADPVSDKGAHNRLDTVASHLAIQALDHEERFSYNAESLPEYVGEANVGADPAQNVWKITKITWENGLPVRKQVLNNIAWTNRATAAWGA